MPDAKTTDARRRGGYFVQCDKGSGALSGCQNTTRLQEPKRWRCADCSRRYGPLEERR